MLLVLARHGAALALFAVLTILGWALVERLHRSSWHSLGGLYTLVVSGYVLSRFTLAGFYRSPQDSGIQPSVAIIVPAFNEGRAIVETVEACCAVDYPIDKLEVVCVNDGSSDDTWVHMAEAAADSHRAVRCIDLPDNRGKRAAMAIGIRATTAEILVFVDSDSAPAPDAVGRIVQAFADPKVGAVSGITHVRNAGVNVLTRLQAARYYISYALLKAAESVVGAVTCCSGCFAAYRRNAVLPVLGAWEHQRFLGAACTNGDDRALTNQILRTHWRTRYDARAESWTKVPDQYATFFRQQLRWKKSWLREGLLLTGHIWRTRPIALPSIVVATLTGLLSPLIIFWNFCWMPGREGIFPLVYAMALYLIAMAYSLYYRSARKDGLWLYACLGTLFYLVVSAQLLWALARVRDGSWGTRRA
jgi:hyaluronan synthase